MSTSESRNHQQEKSFQIVDLKDVNIEEHYTREEKKLSNYISVLLGNVYEVIYESNDGLITLIKGYVESLLPGSFLSSSIVDAWALILNNEEVLEGNKFPRRLFFHTAIMPEELRGNQFDHEARFNMFKSNILSMLKENADVVNLKEIDLVFFPISNINHFFLVVYDLKNARVLVIDNKNTEHLLPSLNAFAVLRLKELFVEYLRDVGHSKADQVARVQPKRYVMDWSSEENFVDYGVFLMRYMETFKGEEIETWNCGFETDVEKQKVQLNYLRKKYLAKILLSPNNTCRQKVFDEMQLFSLKPESWKSELIKVAEATKEYRYLGL